MEGELVAGICMIAIDQSRHELRVTSRFIIRLKRQWKDLSTPAFPAQNTKMIYIK